MVNRVIVCLDFGRVCPAVSSPVFAFVLDVREALGGAGLRLLHALEDHRGGVASAHFVEFLQGDDHAGVVGFSRLVTGGAADLLHGGGVHRLLELLLLLRGQEVLVLFLGVFLIVGFLHVAEGGLRVFGLGLLLLLLILLLILLLLVLRRGLGVLLL
jgi:hypothetical protein